MDELFDQKDDHLFVEDNQRGDESDPASGNADHAGPSRAGGENSNFTDPGLMAILRSLAKKYRPGKQNWHERKELVQSALEYLLELSGKERFKSPLSNFRPKDHAWHAIQRVLRELRGKKKSFSTRIPPLSSLPNGENIILLARPSNPEFQARLAIEAAMAKLDQRPREIVLAWQSPDPDMTFQKIADDVGCSKGTISNVIKQFDQLAREVMDNFHLC
jgi:RNA polymerase sigma factor (sigma-70 family)